MNLEMEEKIMFITNIDPPIFYELAEVLSQNDNLKNLISVLPRQHDNFYRLMSSSGNSIDAGTVQRLLRSLNITVDQLMKCLANANIQDALDVLTPDESLKLVTDIPKNLTVAVGNTWSLSCHAKSVPSPRYQWFFGDVKMLNQNDRTLTMKSAKQDQSGLYTCRIHKKNRETGRLEYICSSWCQVDVTSTSSSSSNADEGNELDTYYAPRICQQPTLNVVHKGAKCCIRCIAKACPEPSYLWYKDGHPTEHTRSSLMIEDVRSYHKGNYKCKVENRLGFVWTDVVALEISPESQFSKSDFEIIQQPIQPADNGVPYGCSVALECIVRCQDPLTYTWHKGSHSVPESNNSFFTMRNGNKGDKVQELSFVCIISNGRTLLVSDTVKFKFLPKSKASHTAEDKIALLIANQEYDNMSNLASAATDVRTVALELQRLEFKIIALLDLNYVEIKKTVDLFCKMLRSGVYGLFYYAGHGFQLQGQCFLLPVDASANFGTHECFDVHYLVERMLETDPALACIFLDTCLEEPHREASAFNEVLMSRPPIKQQNLIYSYSTVWSGNSYESSHIENGFYVHHLKKHLHKNISVWNMLIEFKEEFAKDPKTAKIQVPFTAGTLANKQLSLSDKIIGNGPRFDKCTELWKTMTELPEDQLVVFDEQNLSVAVQFSKLGDVFCNALTMKICLRKAEPDKLLPHTIDEFYVFPHYCTDEVDMSIPQLGADSFYSFDVYTLQRVQNPIECDLELIHRPSEEVIATKKLCFGEPMIVKFMLWKNLMVDVNHVQIFQNVEGEQSLLRQASAANI